MKIEIRDALEAEAGALSDIRVRSKGHWGYSHEKLEAWRPAMIVTADCIRKSSVRSIIVDGDLVGFYALKKEEGLLDHLWLVPEAIGKGVGRFAFTHAGSVARSLGMETLLIISDADAEGFYLKMGARKIGEFYSPDQNRMLPKLLFRIPEELNKTTAANSSERRRLAQDLRSSPPKAAAEFDSLVRRK
ncbi:MAG: GNAT family N-acetyltransferase [Verrucomicrobiota bacterium]